MKERIVILDFGSQYTHLIARRVRELKTYAVILPPDTPPEDLADAKGIILSGGPWSVFEEGAPFPHREIFELGLPILGICYGLQILGKVFGGEVLSSKLREYGGAEFFPGEDPIFKGLSKKTIVWMSHGDKLTKIPPEFKVIGKTLNSEFAAIKKGNIYGLQFHPEVTHTKEGKKILRNFLYSICKVEGEWTSSSFLKIAKDTIVNGYKGDGKAVLAYSGGVDSTVCAVLARKILGEKFIPIFVDTGLLRKGEKEEIKMMAERLSLGIRVIDGEKTFLDALRGIVNPEEKRRIIGKKFIELFEEEARKIGAKYLIQGTLYPDRIESMPSVGPSHTIKTHHNVGGLPENLNLILIEPLKDFFKDEVRKIAKLLKIPKEFYKRHPFPGPGLAVRIIGEVTKERLEILREADYIFINTLKSLNLYNSIWQAFAIFVPVKTVGVMGDTRTYENLIALRAVKSSDGMTADWFPFKKEALSNIARRIMNEVPGVNRVVYDVSSKPPATIEWE
ncbi:MAG: glutamine-hydrolyzing GMP synthase [candidate division WOR-3 bacterium]